MSIQPISETTLLQVEDCSICLDEMIKNVTTICDHFFHKECLDLWLAKNNTCPICRRVLKLPSQPQLSLAEQYPFFM